MPIMPHDNITPCNAICAHIASWLCCCEPTLLHAITTFLSISRGHTVILHHSQLSFTHVVPGMCYAMATFSHAPIVHTHFILYTLRPTLLGPYPLCPTPFSAIPIKLHAHFPRDHCAPHPLGFHACYAPYPFCTVPTMPDAHCTFARYFHTWYASCTLRPILIMPHDNWAPRLLCPMPVLLNASYAPVCPHPSLKIAESRVFILEAFCLTLFKRFRQKWSEKVK